MYNIIGNLHVLCKRFSRSIRETERLHKSAKALTDITLYNAAIAKFENKHGIGIALAAQTTNPSCKASIKIHDATIMGREILTPKPAATPKRTGATIFGVRPGKLVRFCVSATGERPFTFSAKGLPEGLSSDSKYCWITGRAPKQKSDFIIELTAQNYIGSLSQ